jgi:hypothetical protein
MFKKITLVISLFLFVNGILLLFHGLKLPIYQVKKSIDLGGEYISGDTVNVVDVIPDSPAAKAGVQKGDVILSINGKKVSEVLDFMEEVEKSEGKAVILEISRNGKQINIEVAPSYSKEYKRYITGVEITTDEFKELPLYVLIPKTILNTYAGKYDLIPSLKSGLLSLFGLLYGGFQIIVGVGIFKAKKWGLILFLLIGLSYIFTFISIPTAIYQNRLDFFTNLGFLMPYGLSFIFVVSSGYFLINRKQFR